MKKPTTIDEAVSLLMDITGEVYSQEHGRDIDEALELVLLPDKDGVKADFYKYDWSQRKRESNIPALTGTLPNDQISMPNVYEILLNALIDRKYFIEEVGNNTILVRPLVADIKVIKSLVDNYIHNLRTSRSLLLERPKIDDSEEAYREWLIEYHKVNDMNLPHGFHKRNKEQLRGMFMGITEPEKLENRLSERQFVFEFYKAHGVLLPEGFDTWGHKQVKHLYDKLNRRYGNGPQLTLFKR